MQKTMSFNSTEEAVQWITTEFSKRDLIRKRELLGLEIAVQTLVYQLGVFGSLDRKTFDETIEQVIEKIKAIMEEGGYGGDDPEVWQGFFEVLQRVISMPAEPDKVVLEVISGGKEDED